ncbi:MAG: hypothetical protein OEX12_05575 [Gammaproteobacteria bacterium]|nr:hypothetical protein [Gammaproteobacteria bacterium]
MRKIAPAILLLAMTLQLPSAWAEDKHRCLFISSYHIGYAWSDGIEAAVYQHLKERCVVRSVYLDSKREPHPEKIEKRAHKVKQLVEEWKPDVIIAADDNASKFVIKPYYRDSDIPVIFCGINWSVEEYGYPYSNTTGMVEVMPIKSLLNFVRKTVPNARNGVFLSADVMTERKDYQRYKKVFARKGIKLNKELAATFTDWTTMYHRSQSYDFIIVNNNAGIVDWNEKQARAVVTESGQRPTFTVYEWMMPFAMIGVTKDPAEQGEWAAKAASSVLKGVPISTIPIIPNQRWNLWRNDALSNMAKLEIPLSIKIKSRPYKENK